VSRTSTAAFQAFGEVDSKVPAGGPPEFVTSTSTRPSSSRARRAIAADVGELRHVAGHRDDARAGRFRDLARPPASGAPAARAQHDRGAFGASS
jgi:hypothetical protein